jgi:tRNA dimethylallyltransferase
MKEYNCIVVLGPTASGKTRLACRLAAELNGEIISADSRQVYQHLDIGTGKDLEDYLVAGKQIPYHLIGLVSPEEQFYLHQFTAALQECFGQIRSRNRLPLICGGTGLYLDALRKDFSFTRIGENEELRQALEPLSKEALTERLKQYPDRLVAHVDLQSKKRLIRGIELAEYMLETGDMPAPAELPYRPYYLGIHTDPAVRKDRISDRLRRRISQGLIAETEGLLEKGITHGRLERLGLEYKFVSLYLRGELSLDQMTTQLETAIFQFAKRQMTWFRRMEREGVQIHWIDPQEDVHDLSARLRPFLERV